MASKDLPPSQDSPVKLMIKSQFCAKPQPLPRTASVTGQTAMITGSNIGLGLECSRALLNLGLSRLIMACRNLEKGEKAAETLRKKHTAAQIEVWKLDMESYESIQSFVKKCEEELPQLDIAILNAGMTQTDFIQVKSTGYEQIFQVNYLSTALLTILLLPILKAKKRGNSPGRLTVVSSGLALTAKFANRSADPLLPTFKDSKGWDVSAASERYSLTKLLQLMFVLKLSEHVRTEDVIVNAVDPGFTSGSGLHRNLNAPFRAVFSIMKMATARSLEAGASCYLDAVLVKGQESHGSFLMDWKISPYSSIMCSAEGKQGAERLWEETLAEFNLFKVRDILSKMESK